MNGRKGLIFLGAGVIATATMIGAGVGCQDNGSGGSGGSGSGNGGSASTLSSMSSTGGAGTMSTSTLSSMGGNGGSTSSTGTGGSTCGTGAMDASISDIAKGPDNGGLGSGLPVKVTGAVVTSHKFLVSQSKTTGSCLWGVFLSEPVGAAGEYTGVLAVSYGSDAVTNDAGSAFCPTIPLDPAGDAFPDDIQPGDVVDVTGKTSQFPDAAHPLSGCTTQPPGQIQLANVCKVTKTGTATPPTPAVITQMDATKIANGDVPTIVKWSGVKVELDNVTSGTADCSCTTPPMGCTSTSVAGCFGDIHLAGSNLTVADKIYYQGLLRSAAFDKTCHNGPNYATGPATFTKISGFVSDDYCVYAVFPDQKCVDIVPQLPAADLDCSAPGGCTDCMGGPGHCD